MRTYIEPKTREMTIRIASSLMISIGTTGDNPGNADAPVRQFDGTIKSLKYLI